MTRLLVDLTRNAGDAPGTARRILAAVFAVAAMGALLAERVR